MTAEIIRFPPRRSNVILIELRRTAEALPGSAERLAALPMHLVADIGGLRVAIVHGDATSLAGWSFAHDALDEPGPHELLNAVRRTAQVDAFASTHTCLAVLRDLELRGAINAPSLLVPEIFRLLLRACFALRHDPLPASAALRHGARQRAYRCDPARL